MICEVRRLQRGIAETREEEVEEVEVEEEVNGRWQE